MSVLRRPHDHHRDLRTRPPPARLVSRQDQDRHVMSTITKSQRSKAALPCRWSFAGHMMLAPMQVSDLRSSPNRHRRISPWTTKATRSGTSTPTITTLASAPRAPAGGQIAIERAAPPLVSIPAVSFLGGFRTPATAMHGTVRERPASETLHTIRHWTLRFARQFCAKVSRGLFPR